MSTHGAVQAQGQPEPSVKVEAPATARTDFMKLIGDYVQALPFQFVSRLEDLVNKYHPKG